MRKKIEERIERWTR